MLLISLHANKHACFCKGKYSRNYSLGFSEESFQEEYNFLSCCGSLSITNSESNICTQSVSILETYNIRIIIVEVLLSTHCNFKWLSRLVD